MNLARIKLMAFLLRALCVVQIVSLHNLVSALPTSVEKDFWIIKPTTGEKVRAWWLFNDLRVGQEKFYYKPFLHKGEYAYLAGSRIKNSAGVPELQILICFNRPEVAIGTYKKRGR